MLLDVGVVNQVPVCYIIAYSSVQMVVQTRRVELTAALVLNVQGFRPQPHQQPTPDKKTRLYVRLPPRRLQTTES